MSTMCIFPAELVCNILRYTTPQDVVRWRTVSKWFRTITYDPKIWETLYANANYLRPPGPFRTATFEHEFVQSARLEQSWTTRGLQTPSRVNIPFKGLATGESRPGLVGGRWFLVCQSGQRFVLYDTIADAEKRKLEPQVLWEQTDKIVAWNTKCQGTFEKNQCVLYVLMSMKNPPRLTLLEFRLSADSGALSETVTFDIPVSDVDDGPMLDRERWQLLFTHSPFLSIPKQSLIFDTRTRVFYKFPKFRVARDSTRSRIRSMMEGDVQIVPTNTHVIVFRNFINPGTTFLDLLQEPYVIVQAFAVPDSQRPVESGKGLLRLSHEGAYSTRNWPFAVIRNSFVDPTTGAIRVRLLEHGKYDGFISTCTTLTLDTPFLDGVSPLVIDEHRILVRGNVPFNDDLYYDCDAYYDVSDNGYARGLFMRVPDPDYATSGVMKFTIDATQDRCVAVLSGFSKQWVDVVAGFDCVSYNPYVCLDGARGRLSYLGEKNKRDRAVEEGNIVVVEVA